MREVAVAMREVAVAMREVAVAMREVAVATREVAVAMREVAVAMREVAVAMREVAVAMREVAVAMREVTVAIYVIIPKNCFFHREKFRIPKVWIMIHNPWVELRLKSTLGILMWFVVSTVIAYHIGIVDMLGTQTFPCVLDGRRKRLQ
eukprot:Em0246g10a